METPPNRDFGENVRLRHDKRDPRAFLFRLVRFSQPEYSFDGSKPSDRVRSMECTEGLTVGLIQPCIPPHQFRKLLEKVRVFESVLWKHCLTAVQPWTRPTVNPLPYSPPPSAEEYVLQFRIEHLA